MLKAVIFDMDGVIIDSEPIHRKIEQEIFKGFGINMSEDEHNCFTGTTAHHMWSTIKNKYNLEPSVEELVKNKRKKYLDYFANDKNEKPIAGVVELIKELHKNNIKLAIASSSPINIIEAVAKKFEVEQYFDKLITGDSVANSKPAPDIFLSAAQQINEPPNECIVIEDSCNGTIAASRAGMKCIGFKNLNSGNQDLSAAHKIITSYSEVKIDQLNEI